MKSTIEAMKRLLDATECLWRMAQNKLTKDETIALFEARAHLEEAIAREEEHRVEPSRECWYESNDKKLCRKCGQIHDKAIIATASAPKFEREALIERLLDGQTIQTMEERKATADMLAADAKK